MKKFVFVISMFAFGIPVIFSQNIEWDKPCKIESDIQTPNCDASGLYIGSIGDDYFFAQIEVDPQGYSTPCGDVALTKVSNNEVIKVIPTMENEMIVYDISIVDNQIAILSCKETEKDDIWDVRVDYYDPENFRLINSKILYTFEKSNQDFDFVHYAKSDDGSKHGLVLDVINGKLNNKKLKFIVINSNYELVKQEQYITDTNYVINIMSANLTNLGALSIICNVKEGIIQKDRKKDANGKKIKVDDINFYPDINKLQIINYGVNGFQKIVLPYLKEKNNFCSIKLYHQENNEYLAFCAGKTNLICYKLNFNNLEVDELFSENIHYGLWKIDYFTDLPNGNSTIVLKNSDYEFYVYYSGNYMNRILFNWEKSYQVINFNSKNGNVNYDVNVGRNYTKTSLNLSYNQNIFTSTYYVLDNNKLYLIYNTDENVDENYDFENELPKENILESLKKTTKINTRVTIIDEQGNIDTRTIFNSTNETPIILPAFTHKIGKDLFQIAKGLKDVITFGTLTL